jgi:hypothetical protein
MLSEEARAAFSGRPGTACSLAAAGQKQHPQASQQRVASASLHDEFSLAGELPAAFGEANSPTRGIRNTFGTLGEERFLGRCLPAPTCWRNRAVTGTLERVQGKMS